MKTMQLYNIQLYARESLKSGGKEIKKSSYAPKRGEIVEVEK